MSHLKIDATAQFISVEQDPETGAVNLTVDMMTDPIPMKPSEAKVLAMALLAEIEEPLPSMKFSVGAKAITAERLRQITREGFTPDLDMRYTAGELLSAAKAYLTAANRRQTGHHGDTPEDEAMICEWPWEPETFRPVSYRRDLEKAGALLAAEIDRLDRV